MPNTSREDLQKLRVWRTWLLIVVGAGQGVQCIAAPSRQLAAPGYRLLVPLGHIGWQIFGALLLVYALLLIRLDTRPAGHIAGAVLYLALLWATGLNLYWPSLSIFGAGLNCGEFWLWTRRDRVRS